MRDRFKNGFHILVLSLTRSQKFSLHVHNILQAVHLQVVSLPFIGNIFYMGGLFCYLHHNL